MRHGELHVKGEIEVMNQELKNQKMKNGTKFIIQKM
jgi:hypothetical protein